MAARTETKRGKLDVDVRPLTGHSIPRRDAACPVSTGGRTYDIAEAMPPARRLVASLGFELGRLSSPYWDSGIGAPISSLIFSESSFLTNYRGNHRPESSQIWCDGSHLAAMGFRTRLSLIRFSAVHSRKSWAVFFPAWNRKICNVPSLPPFFAVSRDRTWMRRSGGRRAKS